MQIQIVTVSTGTNAETVKETVDVDPRSDLVASVLTAAIGRAATDIPNATAVKVTVSIP